MVKLMSTTLLASALLFSSIGVNQAFAQANALPAVDAAGEMAPLRPDQLDHTEQKTFENLTPGSKDAIRFLYTRGYLRYCQLVVDGSLAPLALPKLPVRENWNRQFLSEKEAREVVDVALGMKLLNLMDPNLFKPSRPSK